VLIVDVSSRMMTIYHIWHVALVQGGLGAGVDDMVGGVGANSALGVGVRKGGARIDAFERGGVDGGVGDTKFLVKDSDGKEVTDVSLVAGGRTISYPAQVHFVEFRVWGEGVWGGVGERVDETEGGGDKKTSCSVPFVGLIVVAVLPPKNYGVATDVASVGGESVVEEVETGIWDAATPNWSGPEGESDRGTGCGEILCLLTLGVKVLGEGDAKGGNSHFDEKIVFYGCTY
jgi:hypothetical protein